MQYLKNHPWTGTAAAAAVVITIGIGASQIALLQKAHASFKNYAAFRGCQTVTSRTDTSGACTLASGQNIKIVQFRGRWYLDGDLPFCLNNMCF